MQIDTIRTHWALTHPGGNITASSFTQPVPQYAVPSGDGVIPFGAGGSLAANGLKIVFYGVGADSATFSANVFAWERVIGLAQSSGALGQSDLWVPFLLASFSGITLDSAIPGLANSQLGTTQYFASAITLGTGNSGIGVEVVSPGHSAHQTAHAVIYAKGAGFVEVRYSTGSSATSCNGLYTKL